MKDYLKHLFKVTVKSFKRGTFIQDFKHWWKYKYENRPY